MSYKSCIYISGEGSWRSLDSVLSAILFLTQGLYLTALFKPLICLNKNNVATHSIYSIFQNLVRCLFLGSLSP